MATPRKSSSKPQPMSKPMPNPYGVNRGARKQAFMAANPTATQAQRMAAKEQFNETYAHIASVAKRQGYSAAQVKNQLTKQLGYGGSRKK